MSANLDQEAARAAALEAERRRKADEVRAALATSARPEDAPVALGALALGGMVIGAALMGKLLGGGH